jgi:hypothetical protein
MAESSTPPPAQAAFRFRRHDLFGQRGRVMRRDRQRLGEDEGDSQEGKTFGQVFNRQPRH